MMRLNDPIYDFEKTIDDCCLGITGNNTLLGRIEKGRGSLITQGDSYLKSAMKGELYLIDPINIENEKDPIVFDNLRKSDLVKVYDQYFVSDIKPARKIYESLLNSAKEKCPFCGGIGVPRNLDHFLPKAHFPQFSIFPRNLVPACRDCNMDGKGQSFSTYAEDQIIQPYLDHDRFFLEQWIYCKYNIGDGNIPGDFEYFVDPPVEWSEIDKGRVRKHFSDFNLSKRYGIKAAEYLGTILRQVNYLEDRDLRQEIKAIIFQPGIDAVPFPNHWSLGMYQALVAKY